MAEETKKILKESGEILKTPGLVVSETIIVSADRSPKDIGSWRDAHRSAESPYYPNRSRLFDLYSDVELDGHLTGIMGKRISTVRNKQLVFKKNKKKVDEMDDTIKSKVFRNILTKILETPAYGISGLEFVPGDTLAFEEIPRKHIKPEFGVISISQSDYTGFEYSKIPNIFVIGEKNDLGYLLKCSFYALIKKGDFSDWAQYVEIFGQPVRVIKYDAYDDKTKIELRGILDNAGNGLSMMIPKQADFEMLDGKGRQGDGKLQDLLKNACNDEMSIVVLGNTETTVSSSSSGYAQSQTHSNQQMEIIKDDMTYVINYLNDPKFIAILKSYNLPVEGGQFEFEKEYDLSVLKDKKDIDVTLSEIVPIADDYFYETYGIPKPDNYDKLKAKMDEQKALQNAPEPTDKPEVKKNKKKKVKPEKSNLSDLSFFEKFRVTLADFFDQAPKN